MATSTLKLHPLAKALPEMSAEEYEKLKRSTEANGLREPVVLWEGKILDGRHRYRACRDLGVDLKTRPFKGTWDKAVQLVLDTNLHRRHLKPDQRALIAVSVYEMRGTGRPKRCSSEQLSNKELADRIGTTVATVRRAKAVRGDPWLFRG